MRVLVCGGRDYGAFSYIDAQEYPEEYNNRVRQYEAAIKILNKSNLVIISGMAKGADTIAARWAYENDVKLLEFQAEWDKYGKSAGFIRNTRMLEEEPTHIIAFPGGKGTRHMVKKALSCGVKQIENIL